MFERWQSLPPNRVFDDKEGNRYIIPYDIGSRVKDEVVSSRDFIKLSATELLFDYYGISRPPGKKYKIEGLPGEVSFEQLALSIADIGPTFTHPTRQEQNTRVLISFPKDLIPEGSSPGNILTEEQQPENQEILGPVVTPPQRIIAEAFHSDEIHSLIRDAENNIQYFSVRAENFKGTIENLSFDEDIKKLNLIVPKIKTFLRENNIEFSKQESQTLEFQFDENYKLKRFLIALEDGTTREPKIGFKTLASEDPFSSYRIMVYFTFLKELAKTKTRSLTLMDFIETYVKPDPVIKYGETSAIDQVKELQEEQRREGDNCIENPVQDLVDFIRDEERYSKFAKKYVTLAQAHAEAVENKFDSTEFHPVLGKNTQDIIDKISTAADLYEQWWAKADGKEIALRLLQCLGVEIPTDICFTPSFLEPNIMGFNENLPVIDWTGDFVIDLENSLTTFLTDTILNVAKGLLNELNLKEVCETALSDILSEKPSFSGDAEADLSISATIAVTMAGTRREKTLSTSVREFFEIEDGEDLSNVDPGKYEILRQELIAIIEDLFLVLTNEEICRLFRGESNDKDIFYIQSLVKNKYANSPALFLFETKTSIVDTFSQLGKEIDLGFCEIQLSEDVQNLKIYDLCTIRSDLIDDCLNPQQLDAELEKLRRAKCEQIERLKDIIENGFMPDTIPPALCTVGENGEKIPGLVNEPATSAYMINNAVDASFEGVYMSFGSEAEQWKDNFITIEDKKKQVDILIQNDPASPLTVNPEVQMLISQGQPSEQFYEEVAPVGSIVEKRYMSGDVANNSTDIVKKEKAIAASLFQTLNNERANPFEIKSTEDTVYFQFDIPASPEKQALSSLLESIRGLQVSKGKPESGLDKITDTIIAACSKENEGKLTGAAIEKLINDLGSMNDIRKVFNAASLLNRPDLFELDNVRYSLRFAQEKIDKNIENFEGYKKSNYISIIANLKDDQDKDVEYEIVRFYEDDIDEGSEIQEMLNGDDGIDRPTAWDVNHDKATFESVAFAKYCSSIWEDNGFDFKEPGVGPRRLNKNLMDQLFANNYYYDVLGFIDSYMLEKIIDSPFFDIQKFEAIDLNPQRTQREIKCNIQNNLLIIDNNKQKIIDDYNKNKCDRRDLIINGKPNPDKLNPFDLALLKQQVLTLIRLYTIDYCLRGVFPVSVFKKDSSIENDRTFIAFIYEMMTEELKSFDDDFYMSFENLCLDIYLEVNDGASPPVSETDYKEYAVNSANEDELLRKILENQSPNQENIDIVLSQEELDENEIEQSLQIQNAIKFLIKDQISNVYEKILLALNSAGIPELKEQFLMSLPEVFVAKDVNNDTFRYLDDLVRNIKDEKDIESLRNILDSAINELERQVIRESNLGEFSISPELNIKRDRADELRRLRDTADISTLSDEIFKFFGRSQGDDGLLGVLFDLTESEASKLPLASKFFVEKYCVVEDYTKAELEAKIEEARLAPPTSEMIRAYRIRKKEEIDAKRGEINNLFVDPDKDPLVHLYVEFVENPQQDNVFITRLSSPEATSPESSEILTDSINGQKPINDKVWIFDEPFVFFKAVYDFIYEKDSSLLSGDLDLKNIILNDQLWIRLPEILGGDNPQNRQRAIQIRIQNGFELYRQWKKMGIELLTAPDPPFDPRPLDDVVNLILVRSNNLKDVVNPESLKEFVEGNDLSIYPLLSVFKSLKYGARLIFLPDDEFKYNNWIDQTNEASEQIEKLKLFNLNQSQGNQRLTKHPFAVAKYEIDSTNIIFDASDEDIKISDLTILQMLGPDDDPLFYNRYKRQLLRGLKQSRGYKFLFDYAFSLYDLSSFYTIFSSITASKKQGVPINWDGTKASLILLIMMTNNRGRYDHRSNKPLLNNPTEFAKAFDKAFDILQSCGSLLPCNLINLGLGGFSSFGFAMKFAIKTPKLIFKGLTELIDPNISIASKIKCLGGDEIPIELISLALLPAPLIPPPFGIGPPLTPLGIAYLLLFGGAFDLGESMEVNTGDLIDTFAGGGQSSVAGRLSSDCSE